MKRTLCPARRYFLETASSPAPRTRRGISRRDERSLSSARFVLFWSPSGTSAALDALRAFDDHVLPTPGSPIRTGLFLVRRESNLE